MSLLSSFFNLFKTEPASYTVWRWKSSTNPMDSDTARLKTQASQLVAATKEVIDHKMLMWYHHDITGHAMNIAIFFPTCYVEWRFTRANGAQLLSRIARDLDLDYLDFVPVPGHDCRTFTRRELLDIFSNANPAGWLTDTAHKAAKTVPAGQLNNAIAITRWQLNRLRHFYGDDLETEMESLLQQANFGPRTKSWVITSGLAVAAVGSAMQAVITWRALQYRSALAELDELDGPTIAATVKAVAPWIALTGACVAVATTLPRRALNVLLLINDTSTRIDAEPEEITHGERYTMCPYIDDAVAEDGPCNSLEAGLYVYTKTTLFGMPFSFLGLARHHPLSPRGGHRPLLHRHGVSQYLVWRSKQRQDHRLEGPPSGRSVRLTVTARRIPSRSRTWSLSRFVGPPSVDR
ncbi:hypothetical protein BDV25DRAFT_139314 [Aspergillus avenaceus]|uniref:Uncharacterized protein n=1 Tax=Aspergillus avenaceus TaxID=36643 RepID=A0A5N6TX69_ASPAV|nr:hypothetical protein BDV25DRAFT_139314 [Aspergillus avenaceus]